MRFGFVALALALWLSATQCRCDELADIDFRVNRKQTQMFDEEAVNCTGHIPSAFRRLMASVQLTSREGALHSAGRVPVGVSARGAAANELDVAVQTHESALNEVPVRTQRSGFARLRRPPHAEGTQRTRLCEIL